MTTHTYHSDVCIVGSGAVGKAAALGFSQAGLRVSILSAAAPSPSPVLDQWDVRVYALNHVAHDLLASLKVWDALDLERVAEVSAMQVVDSNVHSGKSGGSVAFDAYGVHIEELAWIVEDRNLNHALDTALKFARNVTHVVGQAKSFSVTDHHAVITLENGGTLSASLVVGADGAQSWVRGQCDIGIDYRSYGQRGVVTNFACEKPHRGVARQWFVEELGIIALLPLPGQRVSLVWSAPDTLATELVHESLTALAERLAPYCADALGVLTPLQPEEIKAFPLQLIRPHSNIAQRVALIGDAAHVVHPLAGHGMNLGFADVTVLLAEVNGREAHRDCGDQRVLNRYRRVRREEVAMMQMTTDGLARLFGSDLEPVRFVRNVGLNLLNRLPVLKRKLIAHAMGK
ncbi:MAG: FAD-dependent monooxygenase [Undibacterium sp.]|nr:FAD-dependent monooxygenase [Undibacterium sp.]